MCYNALEVLMRIIDIANILKDHPSLKHKFQDLLPELLRKLIGETSPSISYNRFPSRDATGTPGIDGIVKNNTSCEFIPTGDSFWEVGTSGLDKINSDFKKRTNGLPDDIRKNTTFILVFPKYWSFDRTISLVEWQNQNKTEWKDVLVYDAEILNNWIERYPNIALWFLNELGITQTILNCSLIGSAFDNLISSTNPKLNRQIFCEEREKSITDLMDGLMTQNIIYVKSESRFESFGFILSSLLEKSEKSFIDKCLVVNDRHSYDFINKNLHDKILILNFENLNELKVENNRLVIPCYNSNFSGNGIELEIRGQRTMSKLLTDIGLDAQQSTDVNYKSNGNLQIIRRLIAKDLMDKQPKWALSQEIFCILPLMLLQNFDIKNESHIKIAEYITGFDKDIFFQKLSTFIDTEDCPFRIIDNIYQLYNLEETWFTLKKFITDGLFEKLCKLLEFIFCAKQPDDEYTLVSDGITNRNLDSILKIFAFYAIDSGQNQILVDKTIRFILDSEYSNHFLISKNLQILAECSPKSVCEFLENHIDQQTDYLFNLLESNDYCYLLSTINYLLCLEKYKIRVIELLLKIATFNIEYFYSNNPKSDLRDALTPYFNTNALSIKEKCEILKAKIDKDPNMIKLYLEIITSTTCFVSISFKVRKPENAEKPTYNQLKEFRMELDSIILEKVLTSNDIEQINNIIEDYDFFSPEMFYKISDHIGRHKEEFNDVCLYKTYKLTIEKLALIRKFQYHENWVDKKVYIDPFMVLITNTKPNDIFLQYKYMFEEYSDYIDMDDNNGEISFEELEKKRNILRVDALKSILEKLGKEKTIITYINNVPDVSIWSNFLVELLNDADSVSLIFDCCIKNSKYVLLSGFMNQLSDKTLVMELFKEKINPEAKTKMLPLLFSDQYESLCNNDKELEIFYSQKSVGIHTDCDDERYQKFIKYNPIGLLDYFYHKVFDDNLYNKGISLLKVLKEKKDKIKRNHDLWELQELFKDLESYKCTEELALIELDFIEIFEHLYPIALVEYWFNNPKKFIEYVLMVCEDDQKYKFLHHLQFDLRLEKKQYDDIVAFKNFSNTLLNENNDILNIILGYIIGKSCKGKDGIFPHESVREILEKCNDYVNRHFIIGYINSIGARFVGTGESEFKKSNELEENSKLLAIKFPSTSKLLLELSDFHKDTGKEDRKYDLLGI